MSGPHRRGGPEPARSPGLHPRSPSSWGLGSRRHPQLPSLCSHSQRDPHPQMDGTLAHSHFCSDEPPLPAQSLEQARGSPPPQVRDVTFLPAVCPGCCSMRPSWLGRRDTWSASKRIHSKFHFTLTAGPHLERGFHNSWRNATVPPVPGPPGSCGFYRSQTSFTRKRGSVWTCQGPPRPGVSLQDASLGTRPGMLTKLGLGSGRACWAWKAAAHQK